MKLKKSLLFMTMIVFFITSFLTIEPVSACTTITVGKKASKDGSTMTTHTCDSRETRTWLEVVPAAKLKPGSSRPVYFKTQRTKSNLDKSVLEFKGEIPAGNYLNKYFNTALPFMNEHQVAIGEATFDGKEIMQSDQGLIDLYELNRLMIERARTAREAIAIADQLTREFGYISTGECFTIIDPHEVWHLEIIGPGKGKKGAVWVAQRVPDDHVSVNANGSRIRQIDLGKPDYFMASENFQSCAIELGLYNPATDGPFEFCYVYSDRNSLASRRREWRVLDLLAPSLKLDANTENYPFSVKPDHPVTVKQIMDIYRDTFEGTPFDMTKFMLVPELDKDGKPTGKFIKSPYANPFMDYDMMPLFKINGGWNELGERCIARYYCTYVTVIQARSWLPNDLGGLAWFGYDNPAMASYAPLYLAMTDVPESYKICGRPGFNLQCAWWAFNRVADLSAQKWGHMRDDVKAVWQKFETEALENQTNIENQALELYKKSPKKARQLLQQYSFDWLVKIEKAYWKLGDDLWSKYTGKF